MVKAICLGADGVVIGTAELVALECIRCGACESGRGCARGIATTDLELSLQFDYEWASRRIVNLYKSWHEQLVDIMVRFGVATVHEMVGRIDLLHHVDYSNQREGGARMNTSARRTAIVKTNSPDEIRRVVASRERLYDGMPPTFQHKAEEEGGCGVTGFACTIPVAGRHIFTPSAQMHNRGNGKGGGIAAVGFDPDQLGISREVLESHYCLQIAALDPECIEELAAKHIRSVFDIAAESKLKTVKNWQELPSLEVRPPDIFRYFVRVKPDALDAFIAENQLQAMDREKAEDEFVYQNSLRLNAEYYASLGEKKAFVVSQGRNMLVLKIVGYAEDVVRYYCMDDFKAHVWIAHQRFPTKGRVWHPGGAHPFAGLDDALVHNGDFANYQSMVDYLKQRGLRTMFLTDTEVAILVFDYLSRVHNYPLEYIIEALAPTTEMDFDLLPKAKQEIYRKIQIAHMHGSPDGPWFFIIARNKKYEREFQLLGITDTAMLRPQVFAVQNGEVQIGLVCSEKQAIDATLKSLAAEDPRFCTVADKYWNARGGSSSNGGSFIFSIKDDANSPTGKTLTCVDKFGNPVTTPEGQTHCDVSLPVAAVGKDAKSAAQGRHPRRRHRQAPAGPAPAASWPRPR